MRTKHMTNHHPRGPASPKATLLIAALLTAAVCGCGMRDANDPTSPADSVKRITATPSSGQHDLVQAYLAKLWIRSNHTEWDIISGTINPLVGGTIEGVPASWPEGYVFKLDIPAGAITLQSYEHVDPDPVKRLDPSKRLDPIPPGQVELSILVPKDNGDDLPPVYHLLPHGLVFFEEVEVTFCYPPWYVGAEYYAKFYFWEEGDPPRYLYSDLELVYPAESRDLHTDIRFGTWHFSRWGMDNGSGGEEDLLPGRSTAPPFPLHGWP